MNPFKRLFVFLPELDVQAKITLSIIVSLAGSILTYLSIIDRDGNITGSFGAIIGEIIIHLLGRASMVLPLSLFWLAVILLRLQRNLDLVQDFNARLIWGMSLLLGSITGFLNILTGVTNLGDMQQGGGLIGYVFYPLVYGNFSMIGGAVMLVATGLFGFFLVSQLTFAEFLDTIQESLKNPGKFWDFIPDIFEVWKRDAMPTSQTIDSLDDLRKKQARIQNSSLDDSQRPEATTKTTSQTTSQTQAEKTRKQRLQSSDKWKLPRFDILKENFTKSEPGDIEGNKALIKDTLSSFGIEVDMTEVVTGPTVTQYTLKPASGVRLSAIDGLKRDLALALAATSMRLEAPIPGKSLVGIEIPNQVKSVVRLRDILQTKKFAEFHNPLPVALGMDVAGKSLIISISKLPHLVVAGATGSGKSIWINSLLLSLLYRYAPGDLELILVDMKKVELKPYDGVPHLLSPVITEVDKALNALKWSVLEMQRRYKLLEKYGKRNLEDFNNFTAQTNLQEEDITPLPHIVIVIDELNDFMMVAKNEVEPIIVRLTQMSRAVGIHLILGTQRPDTQVLTGLIKANIPSRIAFAVASQIDSRVILDQAGAENLLGQGDGLFMSPSTIKPIRFQGPLAEESEVRKVVRYWKDQVETLGIPTNIRSEITDTPATKISIPGLVESDSEDGEDLFTQCKNYVVRKQSASTSMLQTAFGIGYPKARKFIQMLEDEGVVGPANGSKPREVLISEIS
jgi:S-DNA-T family DNA segregation ATPase FtsK/SpoIIIE